MLNNTMIPSVQVGSGIPLQSTAMSMAQSTYPQQSVAQSAVQQNMAPVQAGSILQLPPGSMVPVQAGNSIVYVATQPIATQQVSVQPQVQYQTQTYQAPVETQYVEPEPVVQSQFDATGLQEAPEYGNTTTPQLRTLTPKVVRNKLPPQYKQVVLPAKVVTTRLPPIGPPPTPELNFQLPPPPAETYQSVTVSQPAVETQVQSVMVPQPVPQVQSVVVPQPVQQVQSVMIPQPVQQVQSVMVPQSIQVPQYQTTSVPLPAYQTASIQQLSQPKFGTTSVVAQY